MLPYLAILVYSAIAAPAIPAQSGQTTSVEHQNSAPTPQVRAYPETADGLHDLIQRLTTAIQKGDSEQVNALTHSLIIPNFQAWFPQVFGAEISDRVAHLYEESIPDFDAKFKERIERLVKDGRTDIGVTRFQEPEVPEKDFYAVKLAKAMQDPVAIYAVKMNKPVKLRGVSRDFLCLRKEASDTSDGTPWAGFQTYCRCGFAWVETCKRQKWSTW